MRPIKFRGKDTDGIIRYGGYSECVIDNKLVCEIMDDIRDCYEVEPDSVAQLVGYDADGNEIYEGEKVFGIGGMMIGHTFTARVANVAMSTNGMLWGFLPEDVRKVTDSTQVE